MTTRIRLPVQGHDKSVRDDQVCHEGDAIHAPAGLSVRGREGG